MKRLLPFCAVLACMACKPPPCTHCPTVAGTYVDTILQGGQKNCDGDILTVGAGAESVSIQQTGSVLSLTVTSPGGTFNLPGTLREDNSASFDPTAITLPDKNGGTDPYAVNLSLQGYFFPGSPTTFSGAWFFEVNNAYGCTLPATDFMINNNHADAGVTE